MFPFVYLGGSSGIILCTTLGPCKMSVNWSTGPYNFVRYQFSACSSCRRRLCFQTLPEFRVPSTRPSALWQHLKFWNCLERDPFPVLYLCNLPNAMTYTHKHLLETVHGMVFLLLPIRLLSILTSHFVMIMIWVIWERFEKDCFTSLLMYKSYNRYNCHNIFAWSFIYFFLFLYKVIPFAIIFFHIKSFTYFILFFIIFIP
jgi:hypothetical protein